MECVECGELVFGAVNDASKSIGKELPDNGRRFLASVCNLVDVAVKEMDDFETLEASVDAASKRLAIGIVCHEVIFQHGREHPFFKLATVVNSFSFSKAGEDLLRIRLNVDGLWG